MPRKPKANIESAPAAAAETVVAASKKRATPREPTRGTRSASTAKATAARVKEVTPRPQPAEKRRARAIPTEQPKRKVATRKPRRTRPAASAENKAVFDPSTYHDDIARLAYHFWEQRGPGEGSPEEDWLRAEEELRKTMLVETA